MRAALPMLAAVLLCACGAEPAPLITVNDARVVATSTSAAAYFTLANSGGDDRLLSVSAAGTGQASLHETNMTGGIMRMRAMTAGIEIPANGRVMLSPSGRHVMIEHLVHPLADGSAVRLTLHFQRQGEVSVDAMVGGPR